MKENNQKEKDLQSRREFFKSAAKVSLPVLSAMILSQFPMTSCSVSKRSQMVEEKESKVSGCHGACTSSCISTCKESCMQGCTGTHMGMCGTCTAQCIGTCEGTCERSCSGACVNICGGGCKNLLK